MCGDPVMVMEHSHISLPVIMKALNDTLARSIQDCEAKLKAQKDRHESLVHLTKRIL